MMLARAVLDVLVAALWQDACIGLAAGAAFALAARRLNAATRYRVLQAVLATMVIVPLAATWSASLRPRSEFDAAPLPPYAVAAERQMRVATTAPQRISIVSSDATVAVLVGAWIAGVCFCGGRLALGALQLRRIARRSTRLAAREGVRIFASPDVRVPFAFGLLAPSVVVPADLAASGGEDYECVLLHELAHVRRNDTAAKLCERLVQAALFYSPPVLFVLRALAYEREAACDDWAVARSRDLDAYVRSLASFAIRSTQRHAVACGFARSARSTFARLRRLEDARRNGTVSVAGSTLAAFGLLLVLLALSMELYAPAIAFAAQDRFLIALLPPDPCPRIVAPPPLPGGLPAGLRTEITTTVSSRGFIALPRVVSTSGNPRFDRIAARGARQLLSTVGMTVPPSCHAVAAGTYHLLLESGLPFRNARHAYRWTVSSDTMRKRVALFVPESSRTR